MAQLIRFRLDDTAAAEIEAMRRQVAAAGGRAPSGRPAVVAAAATQIPAAARAALDDEVAGLALPSLWLATIGTVTGRPGELVLAAVVDAELLAVHAAIHDALAGRVRGPVAAYLPGAWLPHCVLTTERPAAVFADLHPVRPIRAKVLAVEVEPTPAKRT